MNKVTLYSVENCEECVHVKKILEKLVIEYSELDVTSDPYRRILVEKTGHFSVPQLTVGDRYIGNYKAIIDLYNSGRLLDELKPN